MHATLKYFCTSTSLVLALAALAAADDAKARPEASGPAKAAYEAGQPGAEHARLEPLIGTWNYTCKAWMDPSQPPVETQGTVERKWILGKRFVEERISGQNFDGSPGFEAIHVLGYDKVQKKYTSNFHCNMGTGTATGVGTADSSGKTLSLQTEMHCPMRQKLIHGRDEIQLISPDKVVMESYLIEDGKETKMMEIVSTRQK